MTNHKTSTLIASDYVPVLGFAEGSQAEPSWNVNCERSEWDGASRKVIPGRPHRADGRCCLVGLRTIAKATFATDRSSSQCDVCGAWFRFGEVWQHTPSGELITLGHDCADKFSLVSGSRDEALAYQKQMAELRSRNAKEQKLATARDKWLAENPVAAAALAARNDERNELPVLPEPCSQHGPFVLYSDTQAYWVREDLKGNCHECCRKHNDHAYRVANDRKNKAITILNDMYSKLHRYGSLSEKQVAFAVKLAEGLAAPAQPKVEEKLVAAPTGRVTYTGTVISTKTSESQWGTSYRMTVKVTTPEGNYLVNSTVPAALDYSSLKGTTVTVTATLEPGSEAHFAFGKRPVAKC